MNKHALAAMVGLSVVGGQKAVFGDAKITQPKSVVKAAPKRKTRLEMLLEMVAEPDFTQVLGQEHKEAGKSKFTKHILGELNGQQKPKWKIRRDKNKVAA